MPILMGIDNLTELTDADTTGVNAILMGLRVKAKQKERYSPADIGDIQDLGSARVEPKVANLARRIATPGDAQHDDIGIIAVPHQEARDAGHRGETRVDDLFERRRWGPMWQLTRGRLAIERVVDFVAEDERKAAHAGDEDKAVQIRLDHL